LFTSGRGDSGATVKATARAIGKGNSKGNSKSNCNCNNKGVGQECPTHTGKSNDELFCFAMAGLEEEVPGFLILAVFLAGGLGGEVEGGVLLADGGVGHDVPIVGGDDVEGEEVDGAGGIAAVFGAADAEAVASFGMAAEGAFDLDAEDGAGIFDADVVAGEASVGVGDAETLGHGEDHEIEFGPGSALDAAFDAAA